jgi:hypothetical protein
MAFSPQWSRVLMKTVGHSPPPRTENVRRQGCRAGILPVTSNSSPAGRLALAFWECPPASRGRRRPARGFLVTRLGLTGRKVGACERPDAAPCELCHGRLGSGRTFMGG